MMRYIVKNEKLWEYSINKNKMEHYSKNIGLLLVLKYTVYYGGIGGAN